MFEGDPPETARTTAGGAASLGSGAALPPVPTGIQTLMRLAALDPAFRDELLARRGAVADAAGVGLTRSEQAILAAVPVAQLERMVATVPPPPADRRTFLRQAAGAAVLALGGAALAQLGCKDPSPERPEHLTPSRGISPRPVEPPPGPDVGVPEPPPRPAAPEPPTEGGAGLEPPPPRPAGPLPPTAGISPSLPPPLHGSPAPGGAAPDPPPR
jgi:hypothetical protein